VPKRRLFQRIRKVTNQKGEKTGLSEQWWIDSGLLSFFAICIIIAQVWLVFLNKNEAK
jgi:hypothetical protein